MMYSALELLADSWCKHLTAGIQSHSFDSARLISFLGITMIHTPKKPHPFSRRP